MFAATLKSADPFPLPPAPAATAIHGAFDTTVRFWDVAELDQRRCLGTVKGQVGGDDPLIQSLAVSADGRQLAAGRQDGIISLWETAKGVRSTE